MDRLDIKMLSFEKHLMLSKNEDKAEQIKFLKSHKTSVWCIKKVYSRTSFN